MIFKINFKLLHLDAYRGVLMQIFLSFAVSLTTMSDAINVGWTSFKIAELTNDNSTTEYSLEQASFIGILPLYTIPFTLPICIYNSNHLGRKYTLLCGAILLIFSWLILYLVEMIEYIYFGVIVRGIGGHFVYSVSQMYISEIAQANIRGFLVILVPIFMNLGMLVSYISLACLTIKDITIVGLVVVSIMVPLFSFAPESPYYLFMKNKPDNAKESLKILRGTDNIESELDDIKTAVEKNNIESKSILEFFTDSVCKKVSLIVLPVQIFQQTTGIDAVLLFLQVILQSSGSTLPSNYSSIIFGIAKLFACIISLFLVDKLGRKFLLVISSVITIIALLLLGLYFYMKDVIEYDIKLVSWIPLTMLILYVVGYSIGFGTIPFILAGEMFPTQFKAYGIAAQQIMYCISMFSVAKCFASLKDHFGFHSAFWCLAVITIAALLFCIYFVRETKGKTLKQILIDLK